MNDSKTRTTSMVCQLLKVTFLALALALVGCGGAAADGDSRQHMGEIAQQPGDYEPCAGKVCGDTCTLCAPGDDDCFETMVLKTCDSDGACTPSAAACTEPPGDYEPCAGKVCGDSCTICDPSDPDCVETMVLKTCDPDGACTPSAAACTEPPGDYEPCAGKVCGDSCTICDPSDPDCFETMVLKTCDPDGACTPSAAACMTE
ncbi:hypothetical protein [Bradymonas sediminis]|uniref:hypothetical protein n=1 Tax=Bradymonas sediminis TaxID=1548548 RepID=UPI00105B75AA|nr:hypothetical protein [Bradymonas sediminis]TDP64426.1 hypothetical protein DFR33_10987 [Bradymonas sediminis]